jgi:chaperonin cofactor prefoldin
MRQVELHNEMNRDATKKAAARRQSIEEIILRQQKAFDTKLNRRIDKIMATQQELKDAIAELVTASDQLVVDVEADIAQTAIVITKVNELIVAVQNSGSGPDLTEQVAAVKAETAKLQGSTDKLKSDNPALQEAIDAAGAVVPPVEPPAEPA